MEYWVRAYNHKQFRVADFIRDHGFIDWEMTHRYAVGDIVFLYLTAPDSRLTFMMEVEQVEMDWQETEEDSSYYLSQDYYDRWKRQREQRRYVRFVFVKELQSGGLGLSYLREHGLSGAPRSPRRLNIETVSYILNHLASVSEPAYRMP